MTDGETAATPDHDGGSLTSGNLAQAGNPFQLFAEWFAEAEAREPNDPNSMSLATVDSASMPDVRMVLMKGFDQRGFVFYTNLESAKGRQLASNPRAALLFHWKSLRRQVRVRGAVAPVTVKEADAYFATRPHLARIGAMTSRQSEPLPDRRILEDAVAKNLARYPEGRAIPRPDFWSGYRISPVEMEFWRDGKFRLHHRARFTRAADGSWTKALLYP